VSEYHKTGEVSEAFIRDIAEWLHRDVDSSAAEESIPRLLAELHERTSSPLNRTDAARQLGYGSRQTFDSRLVKLVKTFGGVWCHQIDDAGRRVAGAQTKLYLSDPIMAWLAPRLLAGNPSPDYTRLTESAIAVAQAAAVDSVQPGRWTAEEAIGYRRGGSGTEVDLAPVPLPSAAGQMMSTPIEAKWVSRNWRSEARTMQAAYGYGVLATKNVTDTKAGVWALPAPLVALLLN
jgi:hypothetical protein